MKNYLSILLPLLSYFDWHFTVLAQKIVLF